MVPFVNQNANLVFLSIYFFNGDTHHLITRLKKKKKPVSYCTYRRQLNTFLSRIITNNNYAVTHQYSILWLYGIVHKVKMIFFFFPIFLVLCFQRTPSIIVLFSHILILIHSFTPNQKKKKKRIAFCAVRAIPLKT
jgi:hypothetical protein